MQKLLFPSIVVNYKAIFSLHFRFYIADDPHIADFVDAHFNGNVSDCDIFSDDDDLRDPSCVPKGIVSSSSSSEDENDMASNSSTPSFLCGSMTSHFTPLSQNTTLLESFNSSGPSRNSQKPVRTSQRKTQKKLFSPEQPSLVTESDSPVPETNSSRRTYWKNVKTGEFCPLPPAPAFQENNPIAIALQPQDYFHRYIPNDLIKCLTEHTNQRYLRDSGRNLSLTESERKIFLAITIIMSYLKYPRIRMYWADKTRVPAIADNMCRDRYFLIRNNLKLRDDLIVSNEEKSVDKFWKVRPLLKCIETACLLNERSSFVSIDEQMIPFYGHAPARQFVKGKPNPCGLKCFVATAPDGLPLDFFYLWRTRRHNQYGS